MELLVGLGILGVGAGVLVVRPLARSHRIKSYTRGRELRSKRATKKVSGDAATGLRFGNAFLPASAATQHTLVVGTTGSGKSQVQRLFMREPLLRIQVGSDHRALIYDAKGETCAYLRRIGVTAQVYSLNPFEKRSNEICKAVAWDIARDITSPARSLNLAAAFIKQEHGGANGYFTDAARLVLDGIITSFIKHSGRAWTLSDLVNATSTRTRMEQVLGRDEHGKAVIESLLGDDRTGYAVASTVASKMRYFSPVAAMWQRCEHKISLAEWCSSNSILLFGDNETATATLDALNAVMFAVVAEEIDKQGQSDTRRTWLWLDEVRLAGGILNSGMLPRLAVKGRSRGCCLVLAFQDIEGFRLAAGKENADEIVAQCSNIALLRMSGEGGQFASKLVGQYETIEVHHSDSTRLLGAETRSEQRVTKDTMLPSEFYGFPQTNPENGLQGLFISTERGAELVRIAPECIQQVVVTTEQEQRDAVVVRPNADQWLRGWNPKDYKRLGIERAVQEGVQEPVPTSKKLKLRLRTPDGLEEVTLPKAVGL
ncbi:type IV secretory system conjugative DNA transfer family protein [Botrimarina mediterranea]|uniref:Type IV secretion-system coupling protein DNA-binding domain protein n=1 Tax=Botrimarina mediterranea TaxID=2528022 RepID=A0A518K5Y2_9BACT|nr:type IV secretion system DNA-binding domain-containing protein [Botrimarina mediterranea]QDV73199.1 Type IV secretion-system coupling protein DNA-binding domain protein [Botrimarina mediterranea]